MQEQAAALSKYVRRHTRTVRRTARTTIRSWLAPWRKSVHIFRTIGLGDVLMCTPALRELKRINPKCSIHVYTNFPDLLRGLPYIDSASPSKDFPKKHIWMGYEDVVSPRRHLAKILGDCIGIKVRDVKPDCVVDKERVEHYKSAWKDLPRPHILIQRRASAWTPNKDWPDAYWEKLVSVLLKSGSIIEIGHAGEVSAVSEAANYVDLRGKTELSDLIACVAAADIIVSPVSGPTHIAAAVGTPSVLIVGGYELPENTAYEGNKFLYTPIHCSPCWLRTPCPIDRECLKQIAPETVEQAISEIWQKES